MPLETCTILCFTTFFFMPNELGDRLAISTTMFLATCALLYVIGAELPKISNLTPIDYLVNTSLFIQLAIVAVSCVIGGSMGVYTDTSARRELLASAGQASSTSDFFPYSLIRANHLTAVDVDMYSMLGLGLCMVVVFCAFFVYPAVRRENVSKLSWPTTIHKPPGVKLVNYVQVRSLVSGKSYPPP